MRRPVIGFLVAAALCPYPEPAAAQDPNPMYLIHREHVKPAQVQAYEEATRAWISALEETEVSALLEWVAIYGPELGYTYVIPIEGFGGIDEVRRNFATSREDVSSRWASLAGTAATPIDNVDSSVLELRPQLSYLPRAVALDLELPFRKYHWYHVTAGMESRFEEVATRLVALYAEHDIEHGFRFYEVIVGEDLPLYVLVERAHDEADYAARTARIRATVGPAADALFGRILDYTRRVEVMEGMTRGELSYPPLEAS